MKYDPVSRRMFLTAAGGGLLSIPVLASLLPRSARAQASSVPLRFVMVTNEHGSNEPVFFGAMKGKRSTLNLATEAGNALIGSVGRKSLADINPGGDLSYLLSGFNSLRSKMSVLRSLDVAAAEGGPHPLSLPSVASGYGATGASTHNLTGHPSVDWLIAQKISADLPATRRLLVLSPMYNLEKKNGAWVPMRGATATYGLNPNWDGTTEHTRASRIDSMSDTQALMQRFVFMPSAQPPASFDRKSMLDRVYQSYRGVAADPRLSGEDKRKLEAYLSLVGDLDVDAPMPAAGCSNPTLETEPLYEPISGATGAVLEAQRAKEDFRIRNQIRIVAAAMLCDLTRVASFSFYGGSHDYHHSSEMQNHTETTNADAVAFWLTHRRVANIVAQLMKEMDKYQVGGGKTLLDHSLVYWAQQYATVYTSGGGHSLNNMPVLLGGGAAGKLKMGEFIDYRTNEGPAANKYQPEGVPLNNLLVTMMNCFGLKSSDYEARAGQGYGDYSGPLGQKLPMASTTTAGRRATLPYLYQGPALG